MPTKHEDVDANNYKTDHRTCCYDYLKIYMKLGFISSWKCLSLLFRSRVSQLQEKNCKKMSTKSRKRGIGVICQRLSRNANQTNQTRSTRELGLGGVVTSTRFQLCSDPRKKPRSQGPFSTSKVPWVHLVTCLCIPTQAAQAVGPQLNSVNTL